MVPVTDPGPLIRAAVEMFDGGPALWWAPSTPPTLSPDVGAVVATSGSTGAPKLVVLSRPALRAAASSAQTRLGGPLTWHLALPPRYVAGLMVVLRAAVADRPVVAASRDLSDLAATGDGDAVSLVPTQLHRALADPGLSRRLSRFDAVLVGGAGLPVELRERADAAGIRVIETYGMSETCGGCVWDGVALPGVDVALEPAPGLPEGAGRVTLAGPMLFDGYHGDPAATAEVLGDGRLHTADWGRLIDDRLELGGRIDDVVITGGVNVDLGAVRRAVAAVEPDAAVLAVPDPEWGSRIVLFAPSGTLDGWRGLLADSLGREALPRQLVVVDPLPRTDGGKPDRAALLRALQLSGS